MSAVSAVGGGMSRVQIEAEMQVAVLRKQKEVMQQQGEMAVKLIESAVAQSPVRSGGLDVRI